MSAAIPLRPYPDTEELAAGAFALYAPAKINLGLRVLGRRADGFHDLDTLFQEVDWADRLEFHPAAEWRLEVVGAELDAGPSNLVTRAAHALAAAAGVPCRGRVVLHKEIPMGGGLGGGSSDAAVTLLGLSRLWGLHWGAERLHPLAAAVGSDCAFFLYGGLARGRGRGEILELEAGCLAGELLIVVPPFGVSTAYAFSWGRFPLTGDEKSVILEFCSPDDSGELWPRGIWRNDLEKVVLEKFQELGQIKDRLVGLGAHVSQLSGSGSAVYGVFAERAQAEHAARQFGPPFRVRIGRAVQRPRELRASES